MGLSTRNAKMRDFNFQLGASARLKYERGSVQAGRPVLTARGATKRSPTSRCGLRSRSRPRSVKSDDPSSLDPLICSTCPRIVFASVRGTGEAVKLGVECDKVESHHKRTIDEDCLGRCGRLGRLLGPPAPDSTCECGGSRDWRALNIRIFGPTPRARELRATE
jgi:hypothetical protein